MTTPCPKCKTVMSPVHSSMVCPVCLHSIPNARRADFFPVNSSALLDLSPVEYFQYCQKGRAA